MKVIDGEFGKKSDKDKDATASDALYAFAEMAEEYEEDNKDAGQAIIVYVTPAGMMIGGNVLNTAEVVLGLQAAIHSIMESMLTGGDFDERLH